MKNLARKDSLFVIFVLFKADCATFLVFEQNKFVMLNGKCWLTTLFGTSAYKDGIKI